MIAYLRLIHNSKDNISLLRAINTPKRGIGLKTIENLQEKADLEGTSIYDAISGGKEMDFKNTIEKLKAISNDLTLTELIDKVLDASGLINGFYSENTLNLMTSSTVNEIKDINTEMLLNNCINEGIIRIEDVDYSNDEEIMNVLLSSGDLMRLSETDKDIVALALKHKKEGDDVITVTDDYSMQNALKLLNLKFKSVRTKGIEKTIQWKKICKGCRKEYPSDTPLEECDICGSPIIRKRMNARSNH